MIAIVLGTRPEIIKMSPIIRECISRGIDHFILHTGQHYSYEMDRIFFEELELPEATYCHYVGSDFHIKQTIGNYWIMIKDSLSQYYKLNVRI